MNGRARLRLQVDLRELVFMACSSGCASFVAVMESADLGDGNDAPRLRRLHEARFQSVEGVSKPENLKATQRNRSVDNS